MTIVSNAEIAANTLHVYTRVSTQRQKTEGTSLKTQLAMGMLKANALNLKVKHWDEGGRSSDHDELAQRPVLRELYFAIKAGKVRHLYVYDQSRLSRSDAIASIIRQVCDKHGVTLYTKDGKFNLSNANDRLLKQMLDATSEFDNNLRRDRCRIAVLFRIRQGYWHGGLPPYGYQLVGRQLKIDKEEARWVKFIYEERASGVAIDTIRLKLDLIGVKPRRRKRWCRTTIIRILDRPYYIGHYFAKEWPSKNLLRLACPAMISNDLWERARQTISSNRSRENKLGIRTKSTLLAPITYCGHCRRKLGVYQRKGTKNWAFHCTHRQHAWHDSPSKMVRYQHQNGCGLDKSILISDLDRKVIDSLAAVFKSSEEAIQRQDLLVTQGRVIPATRKDRISLHDQLTELQSQREQLLCRRVSKNFKIFRDLGSYRPSKGPRLQRLLELERKIDDLQSFIKYNDQRSSQLEWIDEVSSRLSRFDAYSFGEKQNLLSNVLRNIEIRYVREQREHVVTLNFKSSLFHSHSFTIKYEVPKQIPYSKMSKRDRAQGIKKRSETRRRNAMLATRKKVA